MMERETQGVQHSLQELLCLKVFSETFEVIKLDEFNKGITEWAESTLIAGDASDTVLILASLNLEAIPDRIDVERYLRIYQRENGIQDPDPNFSALVWLRREIGYLINAQSSREIEGRLAFFSQFFLDYPPTAFARITHIISDFYWELYDEAVPYFNSAASGMSEKEFIVYVRSRLSPFYRILNNPDWLQILMG